MCFSHEAMNHVARIEVKSGHRSVRSNAIHDRTLSGTCARAWNIELYEGAMVIAHKPVIDV